MLWAMRSWLLVVLLGWACTRPTPVSSERPSTTPVSSEAKPVAAQPAHAVATDAGVDAPSDAALPDARPAPQRPPPSADLGCKQDRKAREACYARGDTTIYALDPLFLCRGTPSPDEKKDAAARRAKQCECFERVDYDQRVHTCMITP
jgi:hypothetical protein